MLYWTAVTAVALIHIMFGVFLTLLWQERHIWLQEYLDHLESEADAYANEQPWK